MMMVMNFTMSSGSAESVEPLGSAEAREPISSTSTSITTYLPVPSTPTTMDTTTSVSPDRYSESATTSTNDLREKSSSTRATPSALGQINEEEMAQAFELLGQLLGLPEVGPEELKKSGLTLCLLDLFYETRILTGAPKKAP